MSEDKRNDAGSGARKDPKANTQTDTKPAPAADDAGQNGPAKAPKGSQSAGHKADSAPANAQAQAQAKTKAGARDGRPADATSGASPGASSTSNQGRAGQDKAAAADPSAAASGASTRPRAAHIPSGTNRSRQRAAGRTTGGGASTAGPGRAAPVAGGGRGGSRAIALVALLVALVAIVATAWQWYRDSHRAASVNERLNTAEKSMQSNLRGVVMPRLSKFDQRLKAQARTGQQQAHTLALLGDKLTGLDNKLTATQSRTADLAERVDRSGNRWQLHRIESLLRAANRRLQLYHDAQGAQQALQLADQAIGRMADPRLHAVRQRIAREQAAVQALPSPDIEGLSLALAAMVDQVPKLPLAAKLPSSYQPQSQGRSDHGFASIDFSQGWQHFWNSLRRALSGMFTIRHSNATQPALMPPDQAFFLTQNLQLQLRTAQLSLLERNTQSYRQSLTAARQWLGQYYDGDSAAVSSMRAQLDKMGNAQLEWQAPDISASLRSLRQLMAKSANVDTAGGAAAPNQGGSSSHNANAGNGQDAS